MTNPNDRCFPSEEMLNHRGLTKREYFAAMAMQGLINDGQHILTDRIAYWSCEMADAIIEKLNTPKQND